MLKRYSILIATANQSVLVAPDIIVESAQG